jgi:hypothetical protein
MRAASASPTRCGTLCQVIIRVVANPFRRAGRVLEGDRQRARTTGVAPKQKRRSGTLTGFYEMP